ncbi:MAG TPA: co-chaperone YbbN, partial [Alcanivorax sp.]|nr:co-chaperone YbbN [Alcanivorax sp.]
MQDNAAATIDVTEQNVQQLLEHSRQVPVLFGFWASWSQPSQQMTVMLEKLTQEY